MRYSKTIHDILRFVSKRSANFGQLELVAHTERLLLRIAITSYGCGLAHMMNISA